MHFVGLQHVLRFEFLKFRIFKILNFHPCVLVLDINFLSSLQSFVIFVTMCREALDDFRRYRRDKEANSQKFKTFTRDGVKEIPSSKIKVGDLIFVEKVFFQEFLATIFHIQMNESSCGGCRLNLDVFFTLLSYCSCPVHLAFLLQLTLWLLSSLF